MNVLENFLSNIANAIRTKTGKTEKIEAMDFATEIKAIPQTTTGKFQEKTMELTSSSATAISPDSGYDALSKVTVTPKLQSKTQTITTNTTTTITPDSGYAGLSSVAVTTNGISSDLTVQKAIIQKIAHKGTKTFTIPAGKQSAIIGCVTNSQYNAPTGELTCTASKGTITSLYNDLQAYDIQVNVKMQIFKLTNTTGEASTVTLKMTWGSGNAYGDWGTNFIISY